MKKINTIQAVFLTTLIVTIFAFTLSTRAGDYGSKATTASNTGSALYLIEVTHTPEECLKALDEVKASGSDKLTKWNWGCMAGNHTGYLTIEAKSETEALNWVPSDERSLAKVYKLNKFTADQIAEFHKKMK